MKCIILPDNSTKGCLLCVPKWSPTHSTNCVSPLQVSSKVVKALKSWEGWSWNGLQRPSKSEYKFPILLQVGSHMKSLTRMCPSASMRNQSPSLTFPSGHKLCHVITNYVENHPHKDPSNQYDTISSHVISSNIWNIP